MDYQSEVLKAVQEGNAAFESFKGVTFDRLNFLESMFAKKNRPHFGGNAIADDFSEAATQHKSAFRNFLTKGEQHGLGELQSKAMSVGSGTDGGFAVPKVIDGMIEDISVNISPIRAISQVVQISTQDYHRLVNTRGTASGWVGESSARPATNTPQLVDIAPPMGELYANLNASQQMLDDVQFNAEQWLAEQAATEFARAEGAAFIGGNGVNQPRGFLTNPVAATADGSRAFGTLEYVATGTSGAFKTLTGTVNPVDDLFALVSKLKAEYRKDACMVMSKSTLFQVVGMKDYQGRFVFNPATAPGMPDTLLGYPIVEAEDMPGVGANSLSIAFGNFKRGYLICDRIGTRVLRDPFSSKPNVLFYITKRLGGSVLNSECIKLLKFGTA
jgi:HK97 family phage major capsid protein